MSLVSGDFEEFEELGQPLLILDFLGLPRAAEGTYLLGLGRTVYFHHGESFDLLEVTAAVGEVSFRRDVEHFADHLLHYFIELLAAHA